MVTDGIMAAVQMLFSKFEDVVERNAGWKIWEMLSDYDEDEWYAMNDESRTEWIENYLK